jgi:lycopene cyclase CruA
MSADAKMRARARDRVRDAGGPELVERLEHLDRGWRRPAAPLPPPDAPDAGARPDFDVVLAGGGLSLLLAPVMADLGLRVGVFDRGRIGLVHREWNASGPELSTLQTSGLFTPEEVEGLVVARYRYGHCTWHGGGRYPVRGVLDHAVDAPRLLAEVRRRAEARGVALFDRQSVVGEAAGDGALALAIRDETSGALRTVTCRLLVDGRGASSPHARPDLVCPTVGGVLEGLKIGDGPRAIDPAVGEILATTDDVESGRQHVWEAFPGRPGETTVYLFHYARADAVAPGSLLALYARFFEKRPAYKAGDARLLRPTFGHIPGWSRLGPPPRPAGPRVVLVGDAAARHSPLTYCGFGAMLRSFVPAAEAVARLVDSGVPPRRPAPAVVSDLGIHAGTGALSWMMSDPPAGPRAHALNGLLDAAFATLHEMGDGPYGALLRDEMGMADFVAFLRRTARRRPRVYREVLGTLGPRRATRWGLNLAREALGQGARR